MMLGRKLCLHVLGMLVLGSVAIACGTRPPIAWPTATPTPAVFRSEQHHLTVDLPPGWAAAEGPQLLVRPSTGLVALNSWGDPGFWARGVKVGTVYRYGGRWITDQLADGGVYVVLEEINGPSAPPEQYGPEYDRVDLEGLWVGKAPWEKCPVYQEESLSFYKWGRLLRLGVYCRADVPDETLVELRTVLSEWRFDWVPAGDPGWAALQARKQLPLSVEPARFPLRVSFHRDGALARMTEIVTEGRKVEVTFKYRWDEPSGGTNSFDCPPDRCRWWRFEARPNGEVVLVEQGGAEPPTPTPAPAVRGIYTMTRIRKRADEIWGEAQLGYADPPEALREKGAPVELGGMTGPRRLTFTDGES
jgi:hypothetical protein